MTDYTKSKDLSITIGIPLITTIILGLLQIFGKEYATTILFVGIGAGLCFGIVIFGIRFLEKRELRWIGNKKMHDEFKIELMRLQKDVQVIGLTIRENEKLNKLENRISYIEGRVKK